MNHGPSNPPSGAAPSAGSHQSFGVGQPREAHLLDRLTVVHKHRRPVTAVFLVVLAWFMVDSYTTIPQYRSQARLMIEEESAGLAAAAAGDMAQALFWQDPEIYFQTQYCPSPHQHCQTLYSLLLSASLPSLPSYPSATAASWCLSPCLSGLRSRPV